MWKSICNWLLYKRMGWNVQVTEDHPDKYIICLAPHTSNWDFIMGLLPVYRQKHTSMTDAMAETARNAKIFHLCITPEGTRSKNPDWKKGFYFIAQKASIPILLYGLDYERRLIQCTKTIIPSGDFEKDMRDIKLYFKDFKGKIPNNFTIGDVE